MSQLIQSFINQKRNSGYPYNSSAQILSCFDKMLVDNFPEATTITPEIINAILNKIDNSLIFIADITPIIRKENDLIPNPNVMFELGYAISSLSQSRVILLLNKKYGECENLPFDIQHKRITIYNYSEGEDKKNKQNELVSTIKNAISMIANN